MNPNSNQSLRSAVTPNIARLMSVAFAGTLGYFAFSNFLSPYLRAAGVPVVGVGLFYSLTSAFEAPAAFAGGVLSDHFGRRPILTVGRLLRALAWVVVVLSAPNTAGLVAGAIVLGTAGLGGSAYRAIIAESCAPGRRASGFAVVGVVENVTGVIVPLVVGLVATWLGLGPVLVGAAALSGLGSVVFVSRLVETHAARRAKAPVAELGRADGADPVAAVAATAEAGTPSGKRPSPWDSLGYMLSPEGRGALLMTAIWLVTGFVMALTPPIFGLYVTDRFGVGYAGLGAIGTTAALGAALGQMVGGQVADRVGHSRLMVFSLYLTVPSWLLITLAGNPILFGVLNVVTYVAAYVAASCWEAVGANAAPRRVRGGVTGIYAAVSALGAMIGAAVAGVAYSRNILLPWYLMAVSDFSMLLLIAVGRRAALRGFAPRSAGPEAD